MRKKNLLIFIGLLLVLALLVVGCGKKDSNVVAKVNGEEITRSELATRVSRMQSSAGHQGANLSKEQQEMFDKGLQKEALEQLIQEKLVYAEAEKRGLTVDDVKAEEHLEKIKSQFPDEKMFQQILQQQNLTEEALKEYFKYQLTEDALFNAVTAKVKVTEQEVRDYYNENKDNLVKMKASHILVLAQEGKATEEEKQQAKEKAEELIKQLENGADFAKLAEENSDDTTSAKNGGLIDMYFTKKNSNFVQEFVDGAFLLDEGEFSKEPVETQFGYHIIKAEEKLDTFEKLKGQIEEKLLSDVKGKTFKDYFENLKASAEIEKYLEKATE